MSLRDQPLKIGERVKVGKNATAEFDGTHINLYCTNTIGEPTVIAITPLAMAHLHWLSARVSDTFPEAWVIDLQDVLDDDDFGLPVRP